MSFSFGYCQYHMALFIWLIIRLIQLVFSAETVFFSHKKSANSVFQPAYNSSRTGHSQSECTDPKNNSMEAWKQSTTNETKKHAK
jgi:hypothetical protein